MNILQPRDPNFKTSGHTGGNGILQGGMVAPASFELIYIGVSIGGWWGGAVFVPEMPRI